MIVFGYTTSDRLETGGTFLCRACQSESTFFMRRTYRYFHLYFIPLWRLQLIAEAVECGSCRSVLPVTVLSVQAHAVTSPFESGQDAGAGVNENLGNVVTLTERAVAEIARLHSDGNWTTEAAVRITPDGRDTFTVAFDYPLTDGRDWLGESHHIPLLVDRRDAPLLWGKTIDFQNGRFCEKPALDR